MTRIVHLDGRRRPSGYSDGVTGTGRILAVAGQIGWDENGTIVSPDFAVQAQQALRNVLAVVTAAGGAANDVVRMTWYVTDLAAYRAARTRIAPMYAELMAGHYPAMTLVQVGALLEPGALVEIEATAVLSD
jgi:enamine deaminase RidA (YjgF/YER057c/UK114 family)